MALAVTMLTFFHAGEVFQGEWKNSGWNSGNETAENIYQMRIEQPASVQSTFSVVQDTKFKY
jgi:hypothetical protein